MYSLARRKLLSRVMTWLTSAAAALAISSTRTTIVSPMNVQSRAEANWPIETITRATGVISSRITPVWSRTSAAPCSPATSAIARPSARHALLARTPARSTSPIARSIAWARGASPARSVRSAFIGLPA